jgi:Zn-dependent protease
VKIALAGPGSNLLMAVVAGAAFQFLVGNGMISAMNLLAVFLFLSILLNLFLMLFNIIPVHPLDGSKLFFALFDHPKYQELREFVATRGPQILFVAVLVSAFTSLDIFFFISGPAFAMCDVLIGGSCNGYFATIFASF